MKLEWKFLATLFLSALTASALIAEDLSDPGARFMQDMVVGMKKMDHDMADAPMTGNVDHDFAAMMIPHHQGAIDMAKGELRYGRDPVMRRLAQEIIVDQQSEIQAMNRWLEKNAEDPDAH